MEPDWVFAGILSFKVFPPKENRTMPPRLAVSGETLISPRLGFNTATKRSQRIRKNQSSTRGYHDEASVAKTKRSADLCSFSA